MNFYCAVCGFSYQWDKDIWGAFCPQCKKAEMIEVPEFESVEQWEYRTGKPYPDDKAVWGRNEEGHWNYWSYRYARQRYSVPAGKNSLVVAPDLCSPPSDWRPE